MRLDCLQILTMFENVLNVNIIRHICLRWADLWIQPISFQKICQKQM